LRCVNLAWAVLTLAVICCPPRSKACSVAMCDSQRVEMEANFRVVMKLGRTALHGARVEITPLSAGRLSVTELTDRSGRATIKELARGAYHIRVSYLGVTAGDECFHVRAQSSASARSTLRYRWGGYGVPMRAIAGSLEESQPGKGVTLMAGKGGALLVGEGGHPILNFDHGATVPVEAATISLENALTREVLRSQSDGKGLFRFPAVQDGIYVLHIEGGKTARPYRPTDIIVPVSHAGTRDSVVFTLSEDSCGVVGLSPRWR